METIGIIGRTLVLLAEKKTITAQPSADSGKMPSIAVSDILMEGHSGPIPVDTGQDKAALWPIRKTRLHFSSVIGRRSFFDCC